MKLGNFVRVRATGNEGVIESMGADACRVRFEDGAVSPHYLTELELIKATALYVLNGFDDLANLFASRAKQARDCAATMKPNDAKLLSHEATVWEQAANIVRNTAFDP